MPAFAVRDLAGLAVRRFFDQFPISQQLLARFI
jgi:hypothetical protein